MIEKEVLGCFLQDNSLILETSIRPTYFKEQKYQLLFQSMLKLAHEEKAIDRVSLLSDNYDYISQMGGPAFITELENEGKVENFETYERQLIEQYKERQSKILAKRYGAGQENMTDFIEQLEELNELGIKVEKSTHYVLEEMYNLPYIEQTEIEIKSGMSDLDAIIGTFKDSNRYIVGARQSMVKTDIMLKFVHEAVKQDEVQIIFSLEMDKELILMRLISTIGNINLFLANNPYELSHTKKEMWQRAVNTLKKQTFEIYDQPAQTPEFIRAKTRQAKAEHGKVIRSEERRVGKERREKEE